MDIALDMGIVRRRDPSGFGEIGQRHVNSDGGRENAYMWWLMYVTIERSRVLHSFSKEDLQSLGIRLSRIKP